MPLPDLAALRDAGPLLVVAVVILVGASFGRVARWLRLPSITGYVVAGLVIGRSGLDLFGATSLAALEPLTHFALGLIAVTVGAHLNVRRLRNAGRRLFLLLLTESTVTPAIVFSLLWLAGGASPELAALLAAASVSTAPATVVALVSELRAKGVFVKTLVAAVALNNMACIVLFEVARAALRAGAQGGAGLGSGLIEPALELALAAGIGAGIALAIDRLARVAFERERMATAAVVALVLASGLASWLDVSPLLACLCLGLVQSNLNPARDRLVDSVFADFQPAILTVFFTLAGMHLTFEHVGGVGAAALLLFAARGAGKLASAELAMRFAGATERVRRNLGLALIPQAGVAVGLVVLIQGDPAFAEVANVFGVLILTVVTANEIVGPILLRVALGRAGEVGMDRTRLIDFLQEEHIVTDFRARSPEDAIRRLVDLMIRTHHLEGVEPRAVLHSVLERERQASTCLGGGLAVPHGILPAGQPMMGVMAISRDGIDFDTPDGRPVHCIVLFGTSPEERSRHLQVLGALARTIGADTAFQAQLYHAETPAHAYEILHGEEAEDFNYFLEDGDADRGGEADARGAVGGGAAL